MGLFDLGKLIHAAVILAFYCSHPIFSAQQSTQTTAPIPEVSPSVALSALENNSEAQQANLDPNLGTEGIVTYRVVVNPDGSILRREKTSGDLDLQALAEPFVSSWHFKKLLNISDSASSWWSFVGVCFFRTVGKMVPCYLPQNELSDKAPETLPKRLFLVGNANGKDYSFPPLHRTKGARLERPTLLRQIGSTGEAVLDVVIAPDGHVTQAEGISSHPTALLLAPAIQTVRGWRFAPVNFLGKPMEVQLRLKVQYGPND